MAKINFNGKEYNSVDEMPPDARKAYEAVMGMFADKDKNGVPDIMEGRSAKVTTINIGTFVVDGKTYSSLDELPPEARAKYQAAMNRIDANKNGVPDILEGGAVGTDKAQTVAASSTIIVDGKVYSSVDEMPPDVRASYQAVATELDLNKNGVPDVLQNLQNLKVGEAKRVVITNQATPPLLQGRTGFGTTFIAILLAGTILLLLFAVIFAVVVRAR